jgi:hypothetical protein
MAILLFDALKPNYVEILTQGLSSGAFGHHS